LRAEILAQAQNQTGTETAKLKRLKKKYFCKFLFGPTMVNKNTERLLEQNQERVNQLNQIQNQLINQADQQALMEQVQVLEQANLAIQNSLNAAQKGFSLFGWMFRLFSR
jgi:tRNA A22 N-methylase